MDIIMYIIYYFKWSVSIYLLCVFDMFDYLACKTIETRDEILKIFILHKVIFN